MRSIVAQVDDLEIATSLYQAAVRYPDSRALVSLESSLLGSTSISTESLMETIYRRYNRFMENVIVSLNYLIGVFTELSIREKRHLEMIRRGEIESRDVVLPISRAGLARFMKFALAIAAWFSLGSFTRYATGRCKEHRIKDDALYKEKQQLKSQITKYEELLKERGETLESRKAFTEKWKMLGELRDGAGKIKDAFSRVKWDDLETQISKLKQQYSEHKGPSELAHNTKSILRSAFLGSIVAAWIGLSAWIVGKVISFFKKISVKFGSNSLKETDSADHLDKSMYDDESY